MNIYHELLLILMHVFQTAGKKKNFPETKFPEFVPQPKCVSHASCKYVRLTNVCCSILRKNSGKFKMSTVFAFYLSLDAKLARQTCLKIHVSVSLQRKLWLVTLV